MLINIEAVKKAFESYRAEPFNYCIVSDFFTDNTIKTLQSEFLDYDDPRWLYYNNEVENKKTLNDWNVFPPMTYKVFSALCSSKFTEDLTLLTGEKLYADHGLHGGGWHIHGEGGNLNPHLDYFLHPKLHLKRKINIIVYLSDNQDGALGFWRGHDQPEELVKEIFPRVNQAVIFDTENSWHGLTSKVKGIYRKSLAMYYLTDIRKRALFAPRPDQIGDSRVEETIKKRSQ